SSPPWGPPWEPEVHARLEDVRGVVVAVEVALEVEPQRHAAHERAVRRERLEVGTQRAAEQVARQHAEPVVPGAEAVDAIDVRVRAAEEVRRGLRVPAGLP